MKSNNSKQRVFNTKTFYRHLKNMIESLNYLILSKVSGNISKAFTEKIMLAVTEVNGCRYCNYFHTRLALNAGVSEEDIQNLLSGQFENASPDEAEALLFGQHYADTGGNPDPETYQMFIKFYGDKKAKEIIAIIKTIMVGNIYGLVLDAFTSRIKRKSLPGSKFSDEVFILIGIIIFIPVICIQILFQWIVKLITK